MGLFALDLLIGCLFFCVFWKFYTTGKNAAKLEDPIKREDLTPKVDVGHSIN